MKTREQAPPIETVEQRFRRLEAEWDADTKYLSNVGKIVNHAAFRSIIAMGMDVVPIMLRDLQREPNLWVWALPEITGENSVPTGSDGQIAKLTAAWLQWGREKGLV